MKSWTVDEVMELEPCYSRERVEELWGERESLSALDVCDLDIPAVDRLWLLLSGGDHVEPAIDTIAERTVKNHAANCGVKSVEATAAEWLAASPSERRSDASWASKWAAAGEAAWDAGAALAAKGLRAVGGAARAVRAAKATRVTRATWAVRAAAIAHWSPKAAARDVARDAREAAWAAIDAAGVGGNAAKLAEAEQQIQDVREAAMQCFADAAKRTKAGAE